MGSREGLASLFYSTFGPHLTPNPQRPHLTQGTFGSGVWASPDLCLNPGSRASSLVVTANRLILDYLPARKLDNADKIFFKNLVEGIKKLPMQ